jgi:hypothetical protein
VDGAVVAVQMNLDDAGGIQHKRGDRPSLGLTGIDGVVAACRTRLSGSAYPDHATCAAAKDGRAVVANALKVNTTVTDFIA